ncbi:hypothetical protein BU26DRAFT_132405 [Trematosphaeria pertusa]|uniref:Uncharacterized protein n=1 Tax=Trematosphaeria pertusa TaxID=390896 RepID=A0A6A6HX19_9PLEO|nr:uncharacterized protein BU26DRAFT_132405 [Trematosphaeria pertusa]KAF2242754.1 hypothetical protein BU26DRAFT_132405 [Trematosphaeria pertusa]
MRACMAQAKCRCAAYCLLIVCAHGSTVVFRVWAKRVGEFGTLRRAASWIDEGEQAVGAEQQGGDILGSSNATSKVCGRWQFEGIGGRTAGRGAADG